MLVPGIEIPHLCTQCPDYPCVDACPVDALSINKETEAVIVDKAQELIWNLLEAVTGWKIMPEEWLERSPVG